ncbi:MAG: hypothetical protein JO002_15535 [Burkholderiaceae bacterium]|nr:hypothetical protein [Burkholderiaceae bacterium]
MSSSYRSLAAIFLSAFAMHCAYADEASSAGTPAAQPAPAAEAPVDHAATPAPAAPTTPAQRESGAANFSSVTYAEQPVFIGKSPFMALGAVGGLIAGASYKTESEHISLYVKQENIDIFEIFRSEFDKQFAENPSALRKYKAAATKGFTVKILYGICSVPFKDYRPYLSIRMTLTDEGGKEIWNDREYVAGHGDAPTIPLDDFYKSADVFTAEFTAASKEVSALLLKDFAR